MTIRYDASIAAAGAVDAGSPAVAVPSCPVLYGVPRHPTTEGRPTTRAKPLGVLVPHDGSRQADRALAHAVELCLETHARLGLALIQPRVVLIQSPWVCVVVTPIWERDACNRLLRRLPGDISVSFVSSPYSAGLREIAGFAKRLQCDSVLLPYSGSRARLAARILARRGVAVLSSP
jgi:nucleotide-binding universal stress UspA family protein